MAEKMDISVTDLWKKMVEQPFKSRKNCVFKFENDGRMFVVKIFPAEFSYRAKSEFDMLKKCRVKKIGVPKPVELRDDLIIMEYVEGKNLSDLFEPDSEGDPEDLCDKLAKWLVGFHTAFDNKLARGDCILRNFIIKNDSIIGMDFEEAKEDEPISDLGDACAYILGMDPKFTEEKFDFIKILADRYWHHSGKDRGFQLPDFVANSLEFYSQFRHDRDLLMTWAHKIRNYQVL